MDSRTALLNAPRAQRRLLALAAPLVAALLAAAIVWAAVASVRAQAALLTERREDLGRLEAVMATLPSAEAGGLPGADGDAFLAGASDALVQAALQTRLREIAAASGAEVIAVGNLPIAVRPEARFAGLRASLQGTNDALLAAIFAIETSQPYLTIRTARIDTYPRDAASGGPQQLLLQVEIEGALQPEAAGAPADPEPGGGE